VETLWNHRLTPPTPSGRFPLHRRTGHRPPLAAQVYVRALRDEVKQLHDRVEILEARLQQNSTTSSRPPSSDSPYKKPRRRATAVTPHKAGGKPGHPGHRQVLLPPTTVHEIRHERCACGNTTLTLGRPYGYPLKAGHRYTTMVSGLYSRGRQ
jgi:hypothetical protein